MGSATLQGHIAVLEYLLDAGVDVHETYDGLTSFDNAIEHENSEVADLLLSHGAIRNPGDGSWTNTLHAQKAAFTDSLDILQQSLKTLADTEKSLAMAAAISAAAAGGASNTISWLCKQHVQTSFVRGNGRTALHMAIQGRHLDIAHALLDSGQDPTVPDKSGVLPFHMVWDAQGSVAGTKELVVDLVKRGGLSPRVPEGIIDTNLYEKILGRWDGFYIWTQYWEGSEKPTSFALEPYGPLSARTEDTGHPSKLIPQVFYAESVDEDGAFSVYGQMLSGTKLALIKLYEEHSWLYHGEITNDGLILQGNWGPSQDLWYVTFEMTRVEV